jgi:hypothetical protein
LFGVSDEEIGGKDGMAKFVNTSDFLELNVGFALDEGMADPFDQFPLFYGERSIWRKYLFKLQFIYLFLYLIFLFFVFIRVEFLK